MEQKPQRSMMALLFISMMMATPVKAQKLLQSVAGGNAAPTASLTTDRKTSDQSANDWYRQLSPNQKAIFFTKDYLKELSEMAGTTNVQDKKKQQRKVAKAADGKYEFVGCNTTIPGIAQFNVSPYEADTLLVDSMLTQYAYYHDGKYHNFVPYWNAVTRNFDKMDVLVYDTRDWEKEDSIRMDIADQGAVPYITAYDETTGHLYCISMMSTYSTHTDSYDLCVLDPETYGMTKIGHICDWTWQDENYQESINGMVIVNGKIYAIDNHNRLLTIDKNTGAYTILGKMKIGFANDKFPNYEQIVGIQGMVYDQATGEILISHLDYIEGACLYRANPNSIVDGVVQTEKVETLDATYYYMYEQGQGASQTLMATPSDFKTVIDGNNVRLTFTVPKTMANGTTLASGTVVKATFLVDGNAMSLGAISETGVAAGTAVEKVISLERGLHTLSLVLNADGYDGNKGNMAESRAVSSTLYIGYDVPEAPTAAKLTVKNNTATITWKAPAKGQNEQWDATFDKDDLTYTVVRTYDNKVVAHDIKATTVTDSELGDVLHTYTYVITPKSHDGIGLAARTNSVVNGTHVELPYYNSFEDAECLNFFTNHNINDDGTGRTWSWNYVKKQIGTSPAPNFYNNNYWLFTPGFNTDTEHVYRASFDFTPNGNDYTKNVRCLITLGTEADEHSPADTLMLYDASKGDKCRKNLYFRVPKAGKYHVGFWDYSLFDDNDNGGYVILDSLEITEALSINAPARVENLTLTPAEGGKLNATLSFQLPEKTIDGKPLTALSAVKVMVNDQVVETINNPVPGTIRQINVEAINGVNTYAVAAFNEAGEGWPVEVSAFVGPDVPAAVENLHITWGEANNEAEMTWDAPTVGVHGGYIDPDGLTYNIYGYDPNTASVTLLKRGCENTNYTRTEDTGDSQLYYLYRVTASNAVGESQQQGQAIFLGKGLSVPFAEPFAGTGLVSGPWLTDTEKNDMFWDLDAGYYDESVIPVDNDGVKLMLRSTNNEGRAGRMWTPIIDLTGHDHAAASIYVYHDVNAGKDGIFRLEASTNGIDFEPLTENINMYDNAGWVRHYASLEKYAGQRVMLGLYGETTNSANRIFADKVEVGDMTDNDLALSSISFDNDNATFGKNMTVKIGVTNLGSKAVDDYAVLFFVNDVNVGEVLPDEAIAAGATLNYEFVVPVTASGETLKCYAMIDAADDPALDNNTSATLSIVPRKTTLNTPENLQGTLENGVSSLTWDAPADAQGLHVVEDFENMEAFSLDNFNGWTTFDGDEQNTLSMIRLSDNYWPNCHLPQAWQVWNASKALLGGEPYWEAKDGKQCLISWGATGIGGDGFQRDNHNNNDWIISPELIGGSDVEFDAYATTSSIYGDSYMDVLVSSTDRNIESFKKLESIEIGGDVEQWQHFVFPLPADAKYIAFCNKYTEFAILLDNLSYRLNIQPLLQSYNVYLNGKVIGQATLDKRTFNTANEGTFGVSAVYDMGESAQSSTLVLTTGIRNVVSGESIMAGDGFIQLDGVTSANIYNVAGALVASVRGNDGGHVCVPNGTYVVKTDKGTYKVYVK